MDWKIHHSKDVSFPQVDIQLECNSYRKPSKVFLFCFVDIDKHILKFICKVEETRIAITMLTKNNKARGI